MSKHYKVFRFRLVPSKIQERLLNSFAGARRFIWNWGLARKTDHYKETMESLSYADLSFELTSLKWKEGMGWLRDVEPQSLNQSLRDLSQAFINFTKKRSKFPRFKSRKRDLLRFRIIQQVRIVSSKLLVPKIGLIKLRQSQTVDLPIKSATFKRSPTGKWYVSLLTEFEMPDVPLPSPEPNKVVGIDLGLTDFTVLSDDTISVPTPKFYRKSQRKLKRAQQSFSRTQKGSKRRDKARKKLAIIHEKISNKRGDFLHKLTTDLVRKYDAICIEDLNIRGLARTKLAKSFTDASFGEFKRQLTYKCQWNRKHLLVIDRFFPSTKMCHVCGELNQTLTLSDLTWFCLHCESEHNRDKNAAINIRDEGLQMLAAGHAES
jgi:putative transposase